MKIYLISLIIILNIIFRFQVVSHEIGADSFLIHVMANSLSEFGYAKWILHPLSIFGLYPVSYTSSMQFLLSGISQSTGIDMELTIFLCCICMGFLSIFTAYLMAGQIIDDDLFKLLAALSFSTAPAILGYTTWTTPTRGLLIVLAPLLIYLLLKCHTSFKYISITIILAIFLFATHHLFYFLVPAFLSFFILIFYLKFKECNVYAKHYMNVTPFIVIVGFVLMISIPFFTGHFIESSRYVSIYVNYVRYIGILTIPAIGGLAYLVFKQNKNFGEWFLVLTMVFLTIFIYQQTYMKWFLPIFVIPLACIGLINILKISKNRYVLSIAIIFLVLSIIFSGYYQFLHNYEENQFNERHLEESTYATGMWMKNRINGIAVSNDALFSVRTFAVSERTHLLTDAGTINQIYGFVSLDMSQFNRYPLTKEDFWFSGYEGPDIGQVQWEAVNLLRISPYNLNITHFVENTKANGNIIWNHGPVPSKLLNQAYDMGNLVYDGGKTRVWKLK